MFVLNAIWNQLNSKSMIRFKLFFLHSVIRMVNCAEQYIMDVIPPWLWKAGNIFLGKSNFLIFYRKIVEILLHLSFRNNKLFNNCVSREWKVLTTVLVRVPTKKTLASRFFSIAVFLVLKITNKYVFAKISLWYLSCSICKNQTFQNFRQLKITLFHRSISYLEKFYSY